MRGTGTGFHQNRPSDQMEFPMLSEGLHDMRGNGYYEEETMKEINSLNRYIRKFKIFSKLKEVIAREKHEKELFNQRKRLTSNECLWEQLAEAEKRENIIRQELYFAQ